jgi:hypothetical protein
MPPMNPIELRDCVYNYIQYIGEEYILAEMEEVKEGEDEDGIDEVLHDLFQQYAFDVLGPEVSSANLKGFIKEMKLQMMVIYTTSGILHE